MSDSTAPTRHAIGSRRMEIYEQKQHVQYIHTYEYRGRAHSTLSPRRTARIPSVGFPQSLHSTLRREEDIGRRRTCSSSGATAQQGHKNRLDVSRHGKTKRRTVCFVATSRNHKNNSQHRYQLIMYNGWEGSHAKDLQHTKVKSFMHLEALQEHARSDQDNAQT